jgi:uncharacterized membrane protein YtjA (UPF0391 family)
MLRLALVFLIVAIIASIFGFGNIEGMSLEFAKILFFIFVVLFVISLIFGLLNRGGSGGPIV